MSSFFSQDFDFFLGRNQSPSPITAAKSDAAAARHYLNELLAEREKLERVMQILPICRRLLDLEIMKTSRKINLNQLGFGGDYNMAQASSPFLNLMMSSSIGGTSGLMSSNHDGGHNFISNMHHKPFAAPQDMAVDSSPRSTFPPPTSSSSTVVKSLRLDIPVATYPKFNFVGRLLGPQGNSLKRIEDYTNCRVFIRGKGSMKDPREEASQDLNKKEQLRELEMIKYGDRRNLSINSSTTSFEK